MRRVMVSAWGAEASTYAGHRLTLVRNPDIKFGSATVGGIEISHLSHIDKPLTIALTATRGKRKNFTVTPLPAVVTRDFLAEANAAGDNIAALRAVYTEAATAGADTDTLNAIKALATPTTEGQ
jgi:hypothetical protein